MLAWGLVVGEVFIIAALAAFLQAVLLPWQLAAAYSKEASVGSYCKCDSEVYCVSGRHAMYEGMYGCANHVGGELLMRLTTFVAERFSDESCFYPQMLVVAVALRQGKGTEDLENPGALGGTSGTGRRVA